jgi:sterol desaturase/sphingolipid hydroxylase (fatty acid hydroxylase superfamily)
MTIEEISHTVIDSLYLPISYLNNPEKRIHYVYLISSLLLAFYVFIVSKRPRSFLKYVFNKRVWLSTSALVDYKIFIFNSFFKLFVIAPFFLSSVYFSMIIENSLIKHLGYSTIILSQTETLIYYTLALTIFNDLLSYFVHFLFHKIPFLWEFHKTHHSATVLNPVTQYRLHPIELLINNIKFIFAISLLSGLFEYLSAGVVDKILFMEVNILSYVFLMWGSNLRHSHVRLSYFNFLEYIFISPFQHQIHHSDNPKHFNKNMGSKLAIWDWLFGTLQRSQSIEKISFGLGKKENTQYNSFLKNMLKPFINVISQLTKGVFKQKKDKK